MAAHKQPSQFGAASSVTPARASAEAGLFSHDRQCRAFPPAAVLVENTAPALQLCGVKLALRARLNRGRGRPDSRPVDFSFEAPRIEPTPAARGPGRQGRGTMQSAAIVSAMVLPIRRRRAP